MDIDLPKYHNFPNRSNLKETGNFLRTWEISVPEKDSLEWSLVLSHLLSANFGREGDFTAKLQNVTDDLGDEIKIRNCISGFNPFLNRHSCFYDKSLQKLISNFKDRLDKSVKNYSNSQNEKLEESSKILKSNILLIPTTETGDAGMIENFPKEYENPSSSPRITLYYYHKTDEQVCKYNFGMKKEKGKELRSATLKKILKETKIPKKRRKELVSLDKNGESFVISVLKSEHKSTIPEFYESSYVTSKLVDAKYEMDPREKDSDGFSAFYHALVTEDETLVYILHNYAANACHKTDKTFRDPDKSIVSTLVNLRKTLIDDQEMSNDFQVLKENSSEVRHNANQLIRFNDFLIQMCKTILENRNRCDYEASNKVSETITRKNIILDLLETYDSFFFFDVKQVSGNCFLKFDDYCKYNTYYRNLDYSATLFFFDNIFSLKERLLLNNNEYSELESSFFLSVLSSKYFSYEFSKCTFSPNNCSAYSKTWKNYCDSFPNDKYLKMIPLVERLRLKEKIRTFKERLQNVVINDNIVFRLPEEEVLKTLASLPEVKDELEIRRLMYYLETAMKQTATNSKHVLVIQRALQVLGECMVNGRKNPRSLCFLLSVCLPEDTFRNIKQTRNILSHMEEYSFAPKFKAEKDTFLFQGIQKDIEEIYKIFKSIFDIQTQRLAEFLFKSAFKEIEISCPTVMTIDQAKVLPSLKKEYSKLCGIKSKSCYNNSIFKNLLRNIRNITDEKMRIISENIHSEDIENILWPLRYLLMLIVEACKDLDFNHVKNIEMSLDDLITCSSHERKEKVKELWGKYEILISELCEKTKNPDNLHAKKNVESCIEKFKKMIKGFTYFSDTEKKEIRSKIPQDVQDTLILQSEIQEQLESGGQITLEQVKKIPSLFLSKNNLSTLKKTFQTDTETALEAIKKAGNPIKELDALLDGTNRTMKKDDFRKLCVRLKFSGDIKKKLLQLDLGQKQTVQENNLFNILNRIKLLREILIEGNTNICELWRKAKGVKTQQFAKYKIVKRYIRDSEIQASVESLLFDCMILLGGFKGSETASLFKSEIEHLWVKASSLFSGINLRHVLGHGNPTFETVGKLLDPDDLPSVLVEEMLKLIKDEEVIQTMYNFCLKTDSDFNKFIKIMNDEDDKEHVEVRSQIHKCERWKRYSILIPQDAQKTLTSNTTQSYKEDYEE